MKKTTIIILAVVAIVIIYVIGSYNSLVTQNIAVDAQWQQVETQYQRRFDLIPNLVASVKGIMAQEKAVFDAIAEARTRYSGATTANEKALAAGQVESALGRLLVISENYPQLKSSETVQSLMSQLEGTENRVSTERMRFNQTVASYNLKVNRFPSSLIASLFGFDDRAYFESAEEASKAPEVKF
jgi:LemA protein